MVQEGMKASKERMKEGELEGMEAIELFRRTWED